MSRKLASLFAALAVAVAISAPASADVHGRKITQRIAYGDLDLSQPAGVKTLTYRMNVAVDRICGRTSDSASLHIRREIKACRAMATADIVAVIDAPLLTAKYDKAQRVQTAAN
jgi:UrcA family protein